MTMTKRRAWAASLLAVLAQGGCGSVDKSGTAPTSSGGTETGLPEIPSLDASKSTSARFSGTDIIMFKGVADVTTVEGTFDWRTLTGWATQDSSVLSTELIQIGDRCLRREESGPWRESAADDVDGFCDAALLYNPATEFQLISMTVVGEDRIDGSEVPHYRGS